MADDLHELSALYALDALEGDERARFEAHLDGCVPCREQLAGLQGAAGALAFAVAGPAPPAELRSLILDAARAEGQNVVPLRPRRSLAVSLSVAVAVAATAAAVAFGLWAASLDHSLSGERAAVRILGDPLARHIPLTQVRGALVVAPSGEATLAADLPAPPHGKVYEAWVIDASAVQRAGTFTGQRATLTTRVPVGATVKVTLERAGGVDAPTSQVLLSARA
jgi:Anti-sigma-K factor rskA/Putative zinc-finger